MPDTESPVGGKGQGLMVGSASLNLIIEAFYGSKW